MENWKSGRLSAGKLRHRIAIVKPSPVQDTAGGINLSANTVYVKVWAAVEDIGGTETNAAQSEVSIVTHQIVMRFIGAAPSWQPNFLYVAGTLVKDSNGYLQKALTDGVSLADAPVWEATEGMYTEDGDPSIGFLWQNLGPAPVHTGVNASMQVQWEGRQFQVEDVLNPDGRNKMLCLMCSEINDSRNQTVLS